MLYWTECTNRLRCPGRRDGYPALHRLTELTDREKWRGIEISPSNPEELLMKVKAFIGCMLIVALLALAGPALAASLGVSPSDVELEVPGDGSATANLQVHYYSGDIDVSLIGIPLKVEPQSFHVEASSEPEEIELTIYGDESLGSRIYNGYIRFIGKSGRTIAIAVQVRATVTNLVEGETPVLATPEESQPTPQEAPPEESAESILPEESVPVEEASAPEETVAEQASSEEIPATIEKAPTAESPAPPTPSQSFPVLPVVGIAAGAAIIITIIIVVARRRYQY